MSRNVFLCLALGIILVGASVSVGAQTLEGHWTFDEGTGTSVQDATGHGNTGTLNGGLDASGWITGSKGGALQFDGVDDYILVPHSSTIDFGYEDFTISFLMRLTAGANARVLMKGTNGAPGTGIRYEVHMSGGTLMRMTIDDNVLKTGLTTDQAPFVTSDWVHVVCLRDTVAKELRMYLNGNLQATLADVTLGGLSQSEPLYIGRNADAADSFLPGALDDLRIYRGALSLAQIQAIYPPEAPKIYVNSAAAAGGNGSSWTSAYRTIQAALDDAAAGSSEILIGGGTYPENLITANKSQLKMFGGYSPATGERDIAANKTIIDGGFTTRTLLVTYTDNVVLDGLTLQHGVAPAANSQGGNLHVRYADSVTLTDCEITSGGAVNGGGAWIERATATTMTGCLFSRNGSAATGGGEGGGILVDYGDTWTATDCVIIGNVSGSRGGGARSYGVNNLVFENVSFIDNTGAANSAGIYDGGGTGANVINSMTMTNCVFQGNTGIRATAQGGAIWDKMGTLELRNCIFAQNSMPGPGGAIYADRCTVDAANCTFVGNYGGVTAGDALRPAGAAFWSITRVGYDLHHTLRNCIFSGNSGAAGVADVLPHGLAGSVTDVTLTNTLFHASANGLHTGTLDGSTVSEVGTLAGDPDPVFAAFGDEPYRLGSTSPAIDAGVAVAGLTSDIIGTTRPLPGPGASVAAYDIGAYEWTNYAPVVNAGADVTVGISSLPVALNGTATDDGYPNPAMTYTWAKVSGPGTVTFTPTNALSTQVGFSLAGVYVLSLTANDGGTNGVDQITVEVVDVVAGVSSDAWMIME